ncbi:MAG: glycosyltransferase family 2 protein [Acidobacteria bacterium]|nr:glycosyltransferase family 2 protein [Acidobacteriota bacterium]
MSHVEFTIAIPVFNEESILLDNISRLCRYVKSLGDYEILIGSNGSTDRTSELAHNLATVNPRIRAFEIPERKVGRIFRIFLEQARSDLLISLDMDLSTELEFIPRALELLKEHDMVIGSKKMGVQSRSLIRKMGSSLYIYCARNLLHLAAEDYSMGGKAYRVALFKNFLSALGNDTTYVVNCIYLAQLHKARIVEIPVSCQDFRQSKFNLAREAYDKYSHLIWLCWQHHCAKRRSYKTEVGTELGITRSGTS